MKHLAILATSLTFVACGQAAHSTLNRAASSPMEFTRSFTAVGSPVNDLDVFFTDYPTSDKIDVPTDAETEAAIAAFTEKNGRAPDAVELGNLILVKSLYLTKSYQRLASAPQVKGLLFTQVNRSDDIDTNILLTVGKAEGIQPNTLYAVTGEVEFYSNTPTGGFGIGGAPDAVRYGLSVSANSWSRDISGGYYRTKDGNAFDSNPFQKKNYTEMGAVNNGISMGESNDHEFVLQKLNTQKTLCFKTGSKGEIHANFRTHSGFEGYSTWAVTSVKLSVKKTTLCK